MPTIINGIGTWYCGKRKIHRVKAGCGFCGGFTELESYDTTLYFVVFMVPIIPLGKKRILQNCSACQRHRVVNLKDWEKGKAAAFNDVLEDLKADPDNRETIQKSLALATVYQDERLFDKLADALAGHRTDDAEIQAQLGSAYEYFSRWPDAEAAYRRAHELQPTDDTSERIAVCLLKQGRPEEAADHVRHAFESKDPDKAWLIFWLVEGFMAAGMHDEALRVMDVRDELFPALARGKDYQRQRRTAQKYLRSGKPVKSVYLAESKTGFREGSSLGFGWPKYVAAAVALSLLALYLGSAIYRGQNRPVYLVNGWTKPYTVKVNGEDHQLRPGSAQKIEVPEGEVTVDWPAGGEGPQTMKIETSFFGRPFHRPVFVINPDRLALVEREEAVYAETPVEPDKAPELRTGQVLYSFDGADYEFEPFPDTVPVKSGSRVHKTRVGLAATTDPQARLLRALLAVGPQEWPNYLKRLLRLDPDDTLALQFLTRMIPPKEGLEILKPGLAARPIRVEWHRMYQTLTEVSDPTKDLKPEYRQLVEETKRGPDAVYLLGRLEDGRAGEALYLEAARGTPPSAQACAGLSFRYLAQGEFDKAVQWGAKAAELNPADPLIRLRHVEALLAAGKYLDLLKATNSATPSERTLFLRKRLAAHVATGEAGAAEAELNRMLAPRLGGPMGPMAVQVRANLDLNLAVARRDRAKYLEVAGRAGSPDRFAEYFLRGDYKSAAAADPAAQKDLRPTLDWDGEATRAGLLYLGGLKVKDQALADAQWAKLIDALGHGDREARRYAAVANGKEPFDLAQVKDANIHPLVKRVVLAAFARKFSAHAKELDALSKKLDFERDEVSLCLRYVTD
jgi:tetratricopeptide (TPR) repeat protein